MNDLKQIIQPCSFGNNDRYKAYKYLFQEKITNVLKSVRLTDWLMICFASYVMQIVRGKSKTHSFSKFYSKNKNPLISLNKTIEMKPEINFRLTFWDKIFLKREVVNPQALLCDWLFFVRKSYWFEYSYYPKIAVIDVVRVNTHENPNYINEYLSKRILLQYHKYLVI